MKIKIILGLLSTIFLALLQGCLGGPAFALASNANGTVWMEGGFINQDLYKLSVNAREIKNSIIGIAFDLQMDSSKLVFLKYEPGTFLEAGGDPIYLVKSDQLNNKIVFGESLTRDDNFPNGSGKIADFYFQTKDGVQYNEIKDDLTFGFSRGVASTFHEIRQDLDQVGWEGLSTTKVAKTVDDKVEETEAIMPQEEDLTDSLTTQTDLPRNNYLVSILIGILVALAIIWGYKLAQNRRQ